MEAIGKERQKFWGRIEVLRKDKKSMLKFGIFIVLLLLFGITRLWRLTEVPYGMHVDEAAMAYSAWCLAEYGVDRYLHSWPVYITNFGSGQSAMQVYACAALFKMFGYHSILVRLPGVFFSFLNLIFGMLTARKLFPKNDSIPLLTGGLIVNCPYFILAARFGLDCNLMLGMSTVFLYCFMDAIEKGRMRGYILAGVTGGLVLYTYALSYIVLPVFLISALVYVVGVKAFSWKNWFAMAVPMGILAFPLILVQIINIFDLPEFQIGCVTFPRLGYNYSMLGRFSYENLCGVVRTIFIGDEWDYNTAPGHLNFYGLSIVFFLLGADIVLRRCWNSVKNRRMELQSLPLLWFAAMFFLGTYVGPNVNHENGIFYCFVLFAAVGINAVCRILKKYSAAVMIVTVGIYVFCFGKFTAFYFGEYTDEEHLLAYFYIPVAEGIAFIEQDAVLCNKTTQMAEPAVYYVLGALKSPYELDGETIDLERESGNYQFERLGAIDDQYNFIVQRRFVEYSEDLRKAGFTEERFEGYSLFYKK